MFSSSNNDECFSVKNESLSPANSTIMEALQDESRDEVGGMDGKRYALRWRHHQSTVVAEVGSLYRDAALVDVTLACEDQRTYQAHKLVLSACSQYFQGLFSRHPAHQHPIIFLKDVSGDECEALLTYMYRGEVSVNQDQIPRILRVASSLQVRGLAEVETPTSRLSSPGYGDRGGHCGSSSPSPSTGPPTKCVTPISEPHSPNPPSLINPPPLTNSSSLPPLGSHHSTASSVETGTVPPISTTRHPTSLAGGLILGTGSSGSGGSHHLSLPQDFSSPYSLLPHNRHPYDLGSSSLLGPLVEERKRLEEKGPPPPTIANPYAQSLRVKQDLVGSNWESGAVDVGGLSPLSLPDGPRAPFLPHTIFSSFLNQEQQMSTGSQPYGRMFPISDPLRRVDRLCSSGGETRIHKCQYCSRKFKRKDHLKTHVRIHTGERPYKCKICGRGFIQSQQVKIHMKVHIREDSSGLGGSSVLGGSGADARGSVSLYPEIIAHYSDPHMNERGLRPPRDHSNNDAASSPPDHNQDHHHPEGVPMDDSENEFSSEMIDHEFDSLPSSGRFLPAASSSYNPVTSNPSPSPPTTTNHSGGHSPLTVNQTSLKTSPLDEKTCSAIAMKEPYHIATSVKK